MEEKYVEAPDIVTWVDSEEAKLRLEIGLVNIQKEDITLMVDESGYYLSAHGEGIDYVAAASFLRPVKPVEAKATFSDGFLRMEVPLRDPLENYVKVPVE